MIYNIYLYILAEDIQHFAALKCTWNRCLVEKILVFLALEKGSLAISATFRTKKGTQC